MTNEEHATLLTEIRDAIRANHDLIVISESRNEALRKQVTEGSQIHIRQWRVFDGLLAALVFIGIMHLLLAAAIALNVERLAKALAG